jgi:hypothetical protein
LGIDRSHYSLALQAKITYAGSNNTSYQQAANDLQRLAEVAIVREQVRRLCKHIGTERCAERDAEVATYQELPLVERKGQPKEVTPPAVAAVLVDGGRIQILDAKEETPSTSVESPPTSGDAPAAATADDDESERGKHWREDKVGLLLSMASQQALEDPCPDIPETFVDPFRIGKLARQLKKKVPAQEEAVGDAEDADDRSVVLTEDGTEWEPPAVQHKKLVSTRQPWKAFGPMVTTAAWRLGFFAAPRRAFLGDGAENNWTLWRNHFSSFEPILDFIHALSYVFASATAGRQLKEGWPIYEHWIRLVWQGEVEQVIAALALLQVELGTAKEDEAEGSPRKIVAKALAYLQNNKERMRYAKYRRLGLPITTSYVESAVKQFNKRVKGTEKFWMEEGAEEILQLRADYLSEDEPMEQFWRRREARETGQARYRRAG